MKLYFVLCAVLATGCYEYTAFQPIETSVGKSVRVQLTSAGTDDVMRFVGAGAEYLDGNLASMTDSTYTLALTDIGRKSGSEDSWHGEPVTFRRTDVDLIALRKAAPAKSAGMTVVLIGGAALISRAVGGISGTGVAKPGGTGSGQ